MMQWMAKTISLPGTTSLAIEQHTAVFRAIEEKNPTAARKVMGEHLDAMAKLLHTVNTASGTNHSENEELRLNKLWA